MNDHLSCPKPFILNTIKHHVGSINELILQVRSEKLSYVEMDARIRKIGRSMIDLYYGKLTPLEISMEIRQQLENGGCFEPATYRKFISASRKKFKNVLLDDGSAWTLLIGHEPSRYIHIHPARGSKYTLRVGAVPLKTAIYMMAYYRDHSFDPLLVPLVNEVRKLYMREAPIKDESYTRGLRRVLSLLV